MAAQVYAMAVTESARMLNTFFQKIPSAAQQKKKQFEKETMRLIDYDSQFKKAAVKFDIDGRTDELLGLADAVNKQSAVVMELARIYEKELSE